MLSGRKHEVTFGLNNNARAVSSRPRPFPYLHRCAQILSRIWKIFQVRMSYIHTNPACCQECGSLWDGWVSYSNGCPSQLALDWWLWLTWWTPQGSGSQLQLNPRPCVKHIECIQTPHPCTWPGSHIKAEEPPKFPPLLNLQNISQTFLIYSFGEQLGPQHI